MTVHLTDKQIEDITKMARKAVKILNSMTTEEIIEKLNKIDLNSNNLNVDEIVKRIQETQSK